MNSGEERFFMQLKLLGCIICVGILVIIVSMMVYMYTSIGGYSSTPIGFGCYHEDAVLLNQRLENFSECHVQPCLFMDLYIEHATFLPCGHIDRIDWKNKTYFFANEGLRNDLGTGDNLSVRFCYNPDTQERLVKGVYKK